MVLVVAVLLAAFAPAIARAWWNSGWQYRRQITIEPTGAGEPVYNAVVPVRLHAGNFMFADASPTGADLRFVAADDKTPLKYHVARYDAANDLAFVWVQLPKIGVGEADRMWVYYGNKRAVAGSDAAGSYDPAQTAVYHFALDEAQAADATAYANHARATGVRFIASGVVDAAASFDGSSALLVPPSPSLKLGPGAGLTFSAWIKLEGQQRDALVFRQQDGAQFIRIVISGDRVVAQVSGAKNQVSEAPRDARLEPGKWQHLALTVSNRLVVYLDGREVASAPAELPELGGSVSIGGAEGAAGLVGALDEVQLSKVAQSPAWVRAVAMLQRPDGDKVLVADVDEEKSGGEYVAMLALLASAVTVDGWVVVAAIALLGLISFEVMARKALLLRRIESEDRRFMENFRRSPAAMLAPQPQEGSDPRALAHSTVYRIYRTGLQERSSLAIGDVEKEGARLTPEGLQSLRATLGAEMVHEATRLNRQMVMLTLSISGAPFLGLLGTVVGIMITFGTIALAGDVNVNTIAPGVAAALVCTVAGLVVAIPVLFGYNFLSSHIKDILSRMEAFSEELVGRFAAASGR
ncbi:MAG TPA: DUF2341 domain-containing protein [Caldimonas sp.]|nr:DUF2341 domain-containing protein [Caldimonas sp.]